MELMKYDAACRAVAECRSIDEALEFRNRSEALRAYARQAKNRQLEIDACEIRVRAERKTGEIVLALEADAKLVHSGHSAETILREGRIKRSELGIDGNLSAISQRLAKLPPQTFEKEINDWRRDASDMERLTTPLQKYRVPNTKSDRQRHSTRLGRHRVNPQDPFDEFRNPDGRRVVDWRAGELSRIISLARRSMTMAEAFLAEMPVANPDPLDTVEMIFGRTKLLSIIKEVWAEKKLRLGDSGLTVDAQARRTKASLEKRTRNCLFCKKPFVMRRAPRASRPYEGKFCSRKCAAESMRVSNGERKAAT